MLTFAVAAVLNTAGPVLSWLSPVTLSDSSSSLITIEESPYSKLSIGMSLLVNFMFFRGRKAK